MCVCVCVGVCRFIHQKEKDITSYNIFKKEIDFNNVIIILYNNSEKKNSNGNDEYWKKWAKYLNGNIFQSYQS